MHTNDEHYIQQTQLIDYTSLIRMSAGEKCEVSLATCSEPSQLHTFRVRDMSEKGQSERLSHDQMSRATCSFKLEDNKHAIHRKKEKKKVFSETFQGISTVINDGATSKERNHMRHESNTET